jgi:hypothetical protein
VGEVSTKVIQDIAVQANRLSYLSAVIESLVYFANRSFPYSFL